MHALPLFSGSFEGEYDNGISGEDKQLNGEKQICQKNSKDRLRDLALYAGSRNLFFDLFDIFVY